MENIAPNLTPPVDPNAPAPPTGGIDLNNLSDHEKAMIQKANGVPPQHAKPAPQAGAPQGQPGNTQPPGQHNPNVPDFRVNPNNQQNDPNTFQIPAKFEGKSAAEIAKAYVELEQMKSKQANGEVPPAAAPPATPPAKQEPLFDVNTGERLNPLPKFDAMTGKPLAQFDPMTGKPLTAEQQQGYPPAQADPNAALKVDPNALQPLDMPAIQAELNQTGTISAEKQAEMLRHGITQDVVNNMIANNGAQTRLTQMTLENQVGGAETLNSILAWAKQPGNLTDADLASYNAAVDSNSMDRVQREIGILHQKWQASPNGVVGNPNGFINNGQSNKGGSTLAPFQNHKEATAAIKDPKYQNDENYRTEVQQRIAISTY